MRPLYPYTEKFIVELDTSGPLTAEEHAACASSIQLSLTEIIDCTGLDPDGNMDEKLGFNVKVR